ncbi:cell division protein FtsL [Acetobacter oeni]|uniref:Cell division protein FtsL n=1 Tax=Acetobacter oeni TaxID=304077 RepID=A0A511XHY4_9PROT|nr:hypothetical protein [Acetobacter oeni]MBB3882510.1 hypothetical protein [Acetobacter oeni]NHO18678.1 hypothetical protein [Acetobacter oeni]GBR11808.1 hypothetical protein AA21952_3459 [Acetobacter oeni LMG 21952]GEN62553.1 hypothetical protein AOE01nite_07770 [Acetobacter oeni]
MFRYVTLGCAVLAGSSGMYLYTAKHQTTMLDKQISGIVTDTQHIRQQTAMLQTQWALLNQPDRLSHLVARFDPQIQPMAPKQFVRMADLGQHLPAPGTIHTPNPREAIRATLAAADVKAFPAEPEKVASVAHEAPRAETAPVVAERKPSVLVAGNTVDAPKPRLADRHPVAVALASAPAPVRHELVKPARRAADTDDLETALGEKPAVAEHHAAARTMVADATPVHHGVTVSDSERPALHAGVTRVAAYQRTAPRASSPVTVAAWHPTTVASPRYVEARASYNGSLLGRSSLGGGLPPPMPVSN